MRLIGEQYVFVSSANRMQGGAPWDYTITFADNQIACDPAAAAESLALSIASFTMHTDFYSINTANNAFAFANPSDGKYKPVTLTPGNYPFRILAREIAKQVPTMTSCEYKVAQNILAFSFQTPHTLLFPDASTAAAYGFTAQDVSAPPSGTEIISRTPLRPRLTSELCLSLYSGVTPSASARNIDNVLQRDMKASPLLCTIPLSCPPFDVLHYTTPTGAFRLHVQEKRIKTLRFAFTDTAGNALRFMPDHSLVLRVERYDHSTPKDALDMASISSQLSALIDLQRMLFLSAHLTDPLRGPIGDPLSGPIGDPQLPAPQLVVPTGQLQQQQGEEEDG